VLLLHPGERFFPVDPKRYLESCALWRAAPEEGKESTDLPVSQAFDDKYSRFAVQYLGEYQPPR
jgi:hypothetical protein